MHGDNEAKIFIDTEDTEGTEFVQYARKSVATTSHIEMLQDLTTLAGR